MRGILLVTHGALAAGFKESCEMIGGVCEHLYTASLTSEGGLSAFEERLDALEESLSQYDELFILADLTGGAPCKAAMLRYCQRPNTFIVSGLNLAMLLELVIGDATLEELVEVGCKSIVNVTALIMQGEDDGEFEDE